MLGFPHKVLAVTEGKGIHIGSEFIWEMAPKGTCLSKQLTILMLQRDKTLTSLVCGNLGTDESPLQS